MANTSAHFRYFRLSASLCAAAVALTLGARPALGRLDTVAEYGSAEAAVSAPPALSSGAPGERLAPGTLDPVAAAHPDPMWLHVSGDVTADGHGFGIALGLFSGAILVGTLLALFLGLSSWIWAEDEGPSPDSRPHLH
jgi:hypothetical protein